MTTCKQPSKCRAPDCVFGGECRIGPAIPLSDWLEGMVHNEPKAVQDAERGLDLAFARVFATPDGQALLEKTGDRLMTRAEIDARVARARTFWETGAPE